MLSGFRSCLTSGRQQSFIAQVCLINTVSRSLPSVSILSFSSPIFDKAFRLAARKGYMSQSYDPITKSECPEGKTVIIEGSASMLYDTSEAVFYNKVQVLNRDLSIRVISHFAETIMKERKEKVLKKQEVKKQPIEEIQLT